MPPEVQSDFKKSLAFLKAIYGEHRVNIVAIDPQTEITTGRSRPLSDLEIESFIASNIDKRNLYYSVNSPHSGAPDKKLTKEHIGLIHAVWIDADPDKEKPFAEERKRLRRFAMGLMEGDNPPTFVTDSGGGIQAFWLLEEPVAVTPETQEHYEGLSRALAQKYGADSVQNIDRIMRLPYTWNIPTKKKKGRIKALAKCTRIGKRYKSIDFIEPVMASESENDSIDYSQLDWKKVTDPLEGELQARFEKARKHNRKIDDLWNGLLKDFKPSRSESDFTLAKELKSEGFDLNDTGCIMYHFPHGKNKELTAREIIRCYERSGNDFANSLDQETIDRIAAQVNPLKAQEEATQKLINTAQFIALGEATHKNSGIPLFKHFMNAETVNVLFGPSGSGKSFLTLDMAVHLAAGKDWAGFKCKKKMAVLYVCTESGSSFGKRAKAARNRIGVKEGVPLTEIPFAYYPAHVDLLNNKDHLKLINKLIDDLEKQSGYKCGLVIVDTLSAAFGGGNENSEDMTRFVNNMAGIKYAKKTAVIIVHHTGKDESAGARGHSSLKGNVDTEIQIRSEKRGEKYYRTFVSTKQKDDETGNLKQFGLDVVELGKDEDGDPITTCNILLDGDFRFDAVTPSILDSLTQSQILAIKAVYIYHRLDPSPDMLVQSGKEFTPKEVKALILNDLRQNDKKNRMLMSDVGVLLEHLGLCSKPVPRAMTKFLEDQKKGMEQNGIKAFTKDFQLHDEYLEHMEHMEKMK